MGLNGYNDDYSGRGGADHYSDEEKRADERMDRAFTVGLVVVVGVLVLLLLLA